MEDELASDGHVDRAACRALVRGRRIGRNAVDMHDLVGHFARDAAVDNVHDTADRRRAEEQRRGPAQHFDAIGGQLVDDDGVIDAGVRHVDAADTIGEHADAFALKAAQNGPRGIGTEGRGRHARLARQRVADGRAKVARQCRPRNDRSSRQHIGPVALERRGDDYFGRCLAVVGGGRVIGQGRGGERGECCRGEQGGFTHGNSRNAAPPLNLMIHHIKCEICATR